MQLLVSKLLLGFSKKRGFEEAKFSNFKKDGSNNMVGRTSERSVASFVLIIIPSVVISDSMSSKLSMEINITDSLLFSQKTASSFLL